jgi:hypothetical protein
LKLPYELVIILAFHGKLGHKRLELIKLLPTHRTMSCLGLANLKDYPAIEAIE